MCCHGLHSHKMEEEDPVVTEIPVLLSQALAKNLYVFQYPVRPGHADWNDTKVLNSLIKPKNKEVRLEFALDTFSDKYCSSKGEQIALNTDGRPESSRHLNDREREKGSYFKTGTMDKISYESLAPAVGTNYAVAVLQDKELHCTPVQGIVQMRPSYSYFDKQDKRAADSKTQDLSEDDDEEEAGPQQVTVSFSRPETEVSKKAKEKSYDFVSKKSAEEPWCDTVWRHSHTDHAELERLKLFCPGGTGASLCLPAQEYLRSLVPAPPPEEEEPTDASSHDMRTVHELSLVEQCRALLRQAKLLSFSELTSLVKTPQKPDKQALVSALSTAGCCVRGLWSALSTDLYKGPSQVNGVPAPLMCAARDYVLYLFTQSPYVDRRKVTAAVRLPPQEVLDILSSVAQYNSRVGWQLLQPADPAFEAAFPDLMQRQNTYWEAKQRQFHEMMAQDHPPKRQRKKSQRESFSSDTLLSPKARHNSASGDEEARRKNKSATGQGKRTRNHSVGNESAL